MSVEVTYQCNGCEAVETVTGLLQRWEPIRPNSNFCRVATPTIKSAAPDGWIPFDPYTGACYCPTCWTQIESPERSAAA